MIKMLQAAPPLRVMPRIAALAILAGLAAVAMLLVVNPLILRLSDAKDAITQERLLLGRLLIEARKAGPAEVKTGTGDSAVAFLEGATDAERIAGLQAMVQRHATENDLQVMSSQSIPAQTAGELRFVGIQTQLSGGIDSLQRVLHALESGTPTLVVDQLDITRAPPDEASDPDRLLMRVTLVGATPADGR